MTRLRTIQLALLCGCLCLTTFSIRAASVSDYAVQVSAVVQTNPAKVAIVWPPDGGAISYSVFRKALGANTWGSSIAPLDGTASGFADTNVVVGSNYEYRIAKTASGYYGEGYLYSGIEAPLVESRGKVILVVDNTQAGSLSNELARLQQDLVGDGWTVLRHDVPRMAVNPADTSSSVWASRSNELENVKALVRTDYNSDPGDLKAVFLFGRDCRYHIPALSRRTATSLSI